MSNAIVAAEAVAEFLRVRSMQGGQHPEVIYSLGASQGMVELTVADLETLVRSQLGDDVVLAVPRVARRRRAVIDYDEALRREAAANGEDDIGGDGDI